jgi:hypothetical protein
MVLTERGFEVAETGATVSPAVNRSQPESLEPHCFDAEGPPPRQSSCAGTELPCEGSLARSTARSGRMLAGKYLPRRPAMSY